MPAVRRFSRIDTFDLKIQIEKRIGSQKAEKYFNLLTRYLNLKLRKPEFNKLCIGLIGPENVHLHNELIIAILKNATVSKIPPQKHITNDGPITLKAPNGTNPRTGLQSAFPPSPRKGRTPNLRERKLNNGPISIPIPLNEKTRVSENLATIKAQQQQQSATELFSLGSKPPLEVNSVEDGEEVEQNAISPGVHSRSPVRAPFGIKIHTKETRKTFYSGLDSAYHTETCHYSGHLPANDSLINRLKHNLKMEGLDISMDCVNLLNTGLNCFLKRVMKPSIELTRSRTSQRAGMSFSTSVLDFRVATDMNSSILGDVSHVLREKHI